MNEPYPHLRFRKHWEISPTAQRLLGQSEGFVSAISETPIGPEHHESLLSVALVKGARATTAIEGNTLTVEEVEQVLANARFPPSRAYLATEVRNVLDTMNALLDEVVETGGGPPVTRELLLRMHRMIGRNLGPHFDAVPGRFRTDSRIVDTYRCPRHEDVDDLMDRLCAWLREGFPSTDGESRLADAAVQAIIAHVYIEWIHPFGDGNGRTGRLLEFYILLRAGYPDIASHVLSNFYNQTRPEYYRQLRVATQTRSLTAFIDYAVGGFRDGLSETLTTVQQSQLDTAWRNFVHERFGRLKYRKASVLKRRRDLMLAIPLGGTFTMDEIALVDPRTARVYGGLSERTLQRDVELLVSEGLLTASDKQYTANVDLLRPRMARRAGAKVGPRKLSPSRLEQQRPGFGQPPQSSRDSYRASRELTTRESETWWRLHSLDPQLAGLYEFGLRLLWDTDRPGRASALAFVGRELSRGVIDRLSSDLPLQPPVPDADHTEEQEDSSENNRTRIATVLDLPQNDPRVDEWFRLPSQFASWEKYRPGGPPPDEVERAYGDLSSLLFGRLASYYETEAELDGLLAVRRPTVAHAKRLGLLLLRAGQRNYFFSRLRGPAWVKPLHREALFRNPPDSREHAVLWPEGQYLALVAEKAPADVAAVLADIPDDNRNPIVWAIVAMAASRLPPDLATQTVPALVNALQRMETWYLAKDVVKLSVRLASAEKPEAFELARHLLFVESPQAVEDLKEARYRVDTKWVLPRLVGDDERGMLDRLIPALEKLDAAETLQMLLDKVGRIQALSTAMGKRYQCLWDVAHYDLSPDAAAENWDDLVGLLLEHTVGVAGRRARSGPQVAREVMEMLDARRASASDDDRLLYKRFGYGVLAAAGHHLPARIDEVLQSPEALDPEYPAREFAALLRCQYRNASVETRAAYAASVEAGPARDLVRKNLRAWMGSTPTEDEVTDHIRKYQKRMLTLFLGDFPSELQPLAERRGIPEAVPSYEDQRLAEVGSVSRISFGRATIEGDVPSPEELAMLRVEEIVDYVRGSDWAGNEAAAFRIASNFTTYAGRNPGGAVKVLAPCVEDGFSPGISSSLLAGLCDAVGQGRKFDWRLALDTVSKLLRQVAALDPAKTEQLYEWRRAVARAARLISEGCATRAIPADLAESVWAFLRDADAAPVVRDVPYSTERAARNWDVLGVEEDTDLAKVLRAAQSDAVGEVSGAVLQAAVWQYNCIVSEMHGASSDEIKRCAHQAAEEQLTDFLDGWLQDDGPNRVVRLAVAGESLGKLYCLVPDWLEARGAVLLRGGTENPAESPAWTAYLSRVPFHHAIFKHLRRWYVAAAEEAARWSVIVRECEFYSWDIPAIFARHLLEAVECGLLSPGDSDGLLEAAYANLPPDSWEGAYRATYQSWARRKETPKECVRRLADVWTWRISELRRQATRPAAIEEARASAWFLRLPQMDDETLLELGPDTARLAEGRLSLYGHWDRLASLAEVDVDRTFQIIDSVFTAKLGEENPYFAAGEAKPLFELARARGNADTRNRVQQLLNELGERGYRELKSLVSLNRDP